MADWLTLNLPATINANKETILGGLRVSRNKDGRFVVVAMDPKVQAHEHALQDIVLGTEILKINNKDTPFVTLLEDKDPMLSTSTRLGGIAVPSSNLLTLVVRPPTASVEGLITTCLFKPTKDTKVGIAFWQSDPEVDTGHVLVDKMVKSPCKSVAAPLLRTGMRVLTVNNKLVYNCKETADIVRNAQGLLTLLVQIPQETRPLYDPVAVTFPLFVFENYKNSGNGDLGLGLEAVDGKIIISELTQVFASIKNDLRAGMQLVSINNVKVSTPEMAQSLIMGAVACAVKEDTEEAKQRNVVTILAQHIMEPPPGTLVSVSVHKPAANSKLGLIQGMQMPQCLDRLPKDYTQTGHVVIRRITEGGLIASTSAEQQSGGYGLQPGMILHQATIGDKTISLKDKHNKEVSQFLRLAGKGSTVTFLAEVPTTAKNPSELYPTTSMPKHIFDKLDTVALTKAAADQSLGMTLTKKENSPEIMVFQVEENGLAATSGLKVGMQIVKVNNTHVKTVLDVVNTLQSAGAGVPVSMLVMKDAASFIPPVVTGSVYKETKSSKVGIKLRKYKGGSAIVNIKEDSISSSTDLLGGLLIQSINNIEGEKVNNTELAAGLLIEGEGDIAILAVTPEKGVSEDSPYLTGSCVLSKDSSLEEDAFTYEEGKVWISEAGMRGLFKGTSLRAGMEVVTIDNVDCSLLSKPEGVMSMLETTSDDRTVVTILAKKVIMPPPKTLVTATVFKETCESKIGLTYVVDNTKKRTIITRIDNESLAAATKVLPGMELLTINNSPVQGLDRDGVAKLFAESSGVVTYVGIPHTGKWAPDDRMLICVNLDKTDSDKPIGIKVMRDHYDRIVVCDIEEGSLAASSDLIPGLVLWSINNVQLKGKTALDVVAYLRRAQGSITILAEASPFGKLVTTTLIKPSLDTKLGITMVQRNGRVLVKRFVEDSICARSELEIGMWLKSINNRDITRSSVIWAAKLLGREHPVVTILAETTTETFEEEEEAKEEEEEEKDNNEEEAKESETKEEGEAQSEAEKEGEGEAAAEEEAVAAPSEDDDNHED